MTRLIPFLLLLIVSTLGLVGARAQDAGLYDAPPPPDAAIVRVINGSDTTAASLSVASIAFDVAPSSVSPYRFITGGEYDVSGGGALHVSLAAQKYYTILITGDGGAVLLDDAPLANPSLAGLYFYNATGLPLQLFAKVGDKQAAVFDVLPPGTGKFREVKAFDVAFLVGSDPEHLFELPQTTMQRQQGFSVVAVESDGSVSAIQTANVVDVAD